MLYLDGVAGFKPSILSQPDSKSTSSPSVNKSSNLNSPGEYNHGKPTTNSGDLNKPVECNNGNLEKPTTNNGNSSQPITNNHYYYNQPPVDADQDSCCEEGCCIW